MVLEAKHIQICAEYEIVHHLFTTLARKGGAALLQAIEAARVNVNVADPSGEALLMHAVHFTARRRGRARRRMVIGIICLLGYGADPNHADNRGLTAFDMALKLDQKDIAELLFLSGVKFRSRVH